MKYAIVIAMLLAGCAKKPAEETWVPSEWAKSHPVACQALKPTEWNVPEPTVFCGAWRLTFDVTKIDGIQCVASPYESGVSGRVLAVDPSDSRVVVVAIEDGCHQGGVFTTIYQGSVNRPCALEPGMGLSYVYCNEDGVSIDTRTGKPWKRKPVKQKRAKPSRPVDGDEIFLHAFDQAEDSRRYYDYFNSSSWRSDSKALHWYGIEPRLTGGEK